MTLSLYNITDGVGQDGIYSVPRLYRRKKKTPRTVTAKIIPQGLERAGLQLSDIDLFVFHQANIQMINNITDPLGITDRTYNNIDWFGNTTSASVGLALDGAVKEDLLRPGTRVMIIVLGGGFTWGTCILKWPSLDLSGL